jgi:flavin reductase (DIM6/NTAB) family NADH-FMN oxidoreductase RutF
MSLLATATQRAPVKSTIIQLFKYTTSNTIAGRPLLGGLNRLVSEKLWAPAGNKGHHRLHIHSDHGQPNLQNLRDHVKAIMRHVPHPVAVITSSDISEHPQCGPDTWRGITVSSFNTVTIHPRPVVSFNIKKLSATYDAIKSSGLFIVHLFALSDSTIDIAQRFSRGNMSSPFHESDGSLARFASSGQGKSEHDALSKGKLHLESQPPVIDSHNGAVYRLHCENLPDKTVEIEDHVVLFGAVTDGFPARVEDRDTTVCLGYVNGGYI